MFKQCSGLEGSHNHNPIIQSCRD